MVFGFNSGQLLVLPCDIESVFCNLHLLTQAGLLATNELPVGMHGLAPFFEEIASVSIKNRVAILAGFVAAFIQPRAAPSSVEKAASDLS